MPSQSEAKERISEPSTADRRTSTNNAMRSLASSFASGLVGVGRISLGTGVGCAGLAAQLEQRYHQAREAPRSNNVIKVLLQLLQIRVVMPPLILDCLCELSCRVLLDLARDDTVAHILIKLQSKIVTNSGCSSTLAATDAATPNGEAYREGCYCCSHPYQIPFEGLLLLIHEHLQACGLSSSAARLLKEAQLTPLPFLSVPSFLVYHASVQEIPSIQIPWASGRTCDGFLSNRSKLTAQNGEVQFKYDSAASLKKKSLVFVY